MVLRLAISVAALLLLPQSVLSQANCAGLTKAQCRFVNIVGTCSFGNGYFVQEGRVTINGKLIGQIDDKGDIVDETGKVVTELNVIYQNTCKK